MKIMDRTMLAQIEENEHMATLCQLKRLYEKGENISLFLRHEMALEHNTRDY